MPLRVKVELFGKKGAITAQLKTLGTLPPDARREAGARINCGARSDHRGPRRAPRALERERVASGRSPSRRIDVTQPGRGEQPGGLHPVTRMRRRIEAIFRTRASPWTTGPEVEDDCHNFEALNIPANHPARAMHDTFYLTRTARLLRTHTSPVQIRAMLRETAADPDDRAGPRLPPRLRHDAHADVPPGRRPRGGRRHQLREPEGAAARIRASGSSSASCGMRFRPSYFPFTEPSAEVDIECVLCSGRVAACARDRLARDRWAAAWCTRTCSQCRASIRSVTPATRSAWASIACDAALRRGRHPRCSSRTTCASCEQFG